jgi:hypothetical protein
MVAQNDFSNVLLASLILCFSTTQNILSLFTSGLGYLALLLTQVRTTWLSFLVGIFVYSTTQKGKFKIRLIVIISLLSAFLVAVSSLEPFSTVIGTRFSSLGNISEDTSFNTRLGGYQDLLFKALSFPFGNGLGASLLLIYDAPGGSDEFGVWDGSIMPVFFQLGWFGALPYCLGILTLLVNLLIMRVPNRDRFEDICFSIVVAILAQIWSYNIAGGTTAMLFWTFLSLGLAAQKYHQNDLDKSYQESNISSPLNRDIL